MTAPSSIPAATGGEPPGKKFLFRGIPAFAGMTLFLLFTLAPLFAADPLARWADNIEDAKIQREILNVIFPGQIDPGTVRDQATGMTYFARAGGYVRLGRANAYFAPKGGAATGALAVTCITTHAPDKLPISGTAYLFHDPKTRPTAISAGYSTHARVEKVDLQKLRKSFILLLEGSGKGSVAEGQWSAFLLDPGSGDRPRTVWKSPASARQFQLGFADLGGASELLVFRTLPGGYTGSQTGGEHYSAWRWSGDRFEPDSFTFDSKLKALPDDVWQFGTGL
jgi:hypothetical protein